MSLNFHFVQQQLPVAFDPLSIYFYRKAMDTFQLTKLINYLPERHLLKIKLQAHLPTLNN